MLRGDVCDDLLRILIKNFRPEFCVGEWTESIKRMKQGLDRDSYFLCVMKSDREALKLVEFRYV